MRFVALRVADALSTSPGLSVIYIIFPVFGIQVEKSPKTVRHLELVPTVGSNDTKGHVGLELPQFGELGVAMPLFVHLLHPFGEL